MNTDTLLTGENAAFLDEQYVAWLKNPQGVDAQWRAIFESWERPANGKLPIPPTFPHTSIFSARGGSSGPSAEALAAARQQARVVQMVNAYRVRGHLQAQIDPLERREPAVCPELTLEHYGMSEADLDAKVPSTPLFGEPEVTTLRAMMKRLRAAYCRSIGAEFMNITDLVQRRWLQERLETLAENFSFTKEQKLRYLRKISDAENFERMLQARFPGTKRFSLEGADALIPMLDTLITEAGALGAREVVFGMAHRGRLNVLANTLDKPVGRIVNEFQDVRPDSYQGSGDVKYHLGYSSDFETPLGHTLHLSLTPNPSHLEAVDPIVEGRARAKQDRAGDREHATCIPVLLHGDAAFAGQGLVAEVLNLSELDGYRTGGTIHIIVNNQIGFTTSPSDSRSTPYATDIARMLAVPIFHVNGEDPEAVTAVTRLAVQWRQAFKRDVIIDMYCYRKHGHNEGDEPSFTQPLMYDQIRARATPRDACAQRFIGDGVVSEKEAEAIRDESRKALEAEGDDPAPKSAEFDSKLKELWSQHLGGAITEATDTSWPAEKLRDLMIRTNTPPAGVAVHPKAARVLKERVDLAGQGQVDWALGEQAAFATLLLEGYRVRLSGQDSGRGTFSHRHAVLTDVKTNAEYFPLRNLGEGQGAFDVIDSSLSEAGVLGFEFGYSWDYPDALVLWEAQFGDFVNGAQVMIDQYLASAEQKWGRLSGLVLLLPHGYEGQGPEHSSARLERFLQLCAEDNFQVANCTTPANLFHMLRQQVLRKVRKPLVVMTPKGFLRTARSSLDDLATGTFRPVLADPRQPDAAQVKRVVLCSGKVYYDLEDARTKANVTDVALVRVERLYPLPAAEIAAVLAGYPGAEVVWCQEEPRNMGAWPMFLHWFHELLPNQVPRYAGRPASASPATGSHKAHGREQARLLADALGLPQS